jgi:hypothetical protein
LVESPDAPGEPSRLVPPQLPKTHVAHGDIQKWEESFRRTWTPRQADLIEELVEAEMQNGMEQ